MGSPDVFETSPMDLFSAPPRMINPFSDLSTETGVYQLPSALDVVLTSGTADITAPPMAPTLLKRRRTQPDMPGGGGERRASIELASFNNMSLLDRRLSVGLLDGELSHLFGNGQPSVFGLETLTE